MLVQRRLFLALILFVTVPLPGCTLIGGTYGASIQGPSQHPPSAVHEFDRGRRIRLFLFDGARVEGRYDGFSTWSTDEYAALWRERTGRLGLELDLGPGARVDPTGPQGSLHGVEVRGLLIQPNPDGAATLVPWSAFAALADSRGHVVSADTLAEHVRNGYLPTKTRLDLQIGGAAHHVPLGDVALVGTDSSKGLLIGVGTGAAIDALTLYYVAHVFDNVKFGY
jgi:hypothetical protein